MSILRNNLILFLVLSIILILWDNVCSADTLYEAMNSNHEGMLNTLTRSFVSQVAETTEPIKQASRRLFFILLPISIVLCGIRTVFMDGTVQTFFYELVMLCILSGIFLFLLDNGQSIGISIIDSFLSLVDDDKKVGPSELLDLTVNMAMLFFKSRLISLHHPLTSFYLCLLITVFTVVMFLVVIKFMCAFVGAYVLCYAGVFVLGFGAFSHTRAFAINYLKMVLSTALELFILIIIIKSSCNLLVDIYQSAKTSIDDNHTFEFTDYSVILFLALLLHSLSSYLPGHIASLMGVNQSSRGQDGVIRKLIGTGRMLFR